MSEERFRGKPQLRPDSIIPELNLGSTERQHYGVIVTARHQGTGAMRTFHRAGTPRAALLEIIEEVDALGGDWRVASISSPPSVYRDLWGHRISDEGTKGSLDRSVSDPRTSEQSALAKVKRVDLLEPARGSERWRRRAAA